MKSERPRQHRADTLFRAAGGMGLGFGLTAQALYLGSSRWSPGVNDPGLLFVTAATTGLVAGLLLAVPLLFRRSQPRWVFRGFLLLGALAAAAGRLYDHLNGLGQG